jgi:hypothetical protein
VRKISRLTGFAAIYLWTTMPLLFDLVSSGRHDALFKEAAHILILALGVFIYAVHWPERWFPGRFDFVGHSHNLLHFFGCLSVYLQYSSLCSQRKRRNVAGEGLGAGEMAQFSRRLATLMPVLLLADVVILAVCMRAKRKLSDDNGDEDDTLRTETSSEDDLTVFSEHEKTD